MQTLISPDRAVDRKAPTPAIDNGIIHVARSTREVNEVIDRWKRLGPQTIAHDLECAESCTVENGTGLHPHLGTMRLAQFAVRDGGSGRAEALVLDCWESAPDAALQLLADPEWRTVIHFTPMEIMWLGWTRGLRLQNVVDTHIAGKLGYRRLREEGRWQSSHPEDVERAEQGKEPRWALDITCERVLGYSMDKTEQHSFWDQKTLTPSQFEYAGIDVLALLDLEPHLIQHLTAEDWDEHDAKIARTTERALRVPPDGQLMRGCESDRVLGIIDQCASVEEIDRVAAALPQTRLHYTARGRVLEALEQARERLERGQAPAALGPVSVPSMMPRF